MLKRAIDWVSKHITTMGYVLGGGVAGASSILFIGNYSDFHLENSVSIQMDPFEIISVVINGFLAIYIARNLFKQNDLEKTEKEFLIEYLKEFRSEYNSKTDELLKLTDFETPTTKSYLKVLRLKNESILKLGKENKLIANDDKIAQDIIQKVTDIWKLFTDTTKREDIALQAKEILKTKTISKPEAMVQAKEILHLKKIGEIEIATIELDKLIFEMILQINRS